MPSEDFDKKIKLAAEQHHPAYDEKAWLKMEKLLSRYLPQQKNNRRKVFFFLLAFLIIGGGTFLIISKHWNRAHFSEELPQSNKNKVQEKNPESANKSEVTHTDAEIDKTRNSEVIK